MTSSSMRALCASLALVCAGAASAQLPYTPAVPSSGVNAAFPAQNPLGPVGIANNSVNYPYPGQCIADPANQALFPLTPVCGALGSFAAPSQRTAGDWADAGRLIPPVALNPILPTSVPPAGVPATPKFAWNVLNPFDYAPDTTTYPGADYYEIGVHEAWGFQAVASAGLFPNPGGAGVPNGMQWTGLLCNIATGCTCPADASASFRATYCTAGGKIPAGAPLFTPIWGVGQINMSGGPATQVLAGAGLFNPGAQPASAWSANNYIATWPSISIRATRGRPVVVKWVNEFPNNHVLCPHPDAADWHCGIDRTFMGVKARVDPGLAHTASVPPDGVNQFGSPQQPDNSWVTHLHGGEIPPSTDGFAEKWFGNSVTSQAYANLFVNPPFENPSFITLKRPAGFSDVYTYPMVQEEATIWFHDHTLGKTHHNVIAGPAGFFPVKEPAKHGGLGAGAGICPAGVASCTTEYTWLDPVTEPRSDLPGAPGVVPKFDMFLAIQDRSFNDDGSINFANGGGQIQPVPALAVGQTPVTPGANPQVHPVWVPEYFGDHALVNGVLWPKAPVAAGWYRLRVVDGSDSRCWTIALNKALPAPGTRPSTGSRIPFWVIGNDQGYLQAPVATNQFTMCPGERYELLVNFGAIPGVRAGTPVSIYMTNIAAAPFPAGVTPFAAGSPYAEMNTIMRFDVNPANGPGVKSCAVGAQTSWDPTWTQAQMTAAITAGQACMPANPALQVDPNFVDLRPAVAGAVVRQVYLNERVDGTTLAPFGMQLNGVPFEYKVTETPRKGTKEVWKFINLTVDAHPLHPHLVSHQIVERQTFSVGRYKAALCGSTTCQPGPVPGNEMQVIPDVTPFLTGAPVPVTAASFEGGRKDATQVPPGQVTTIIADWSPRWKDVGVVNAPGQGPLDGSNASTWTYEDVTAGPYVWHCHINSHEDSEMMRTSLVVK
ncbi:MAG: multicopper oxidase domain-containing protein [Anaeromyxobacter sp.]